MKVLIANRGEIARRIERTCVSLGHDVVGVHVDGDAGSARALQHRDVELVPSYLDQAAIIDAARRSGATAVHPGFGFLAENADFAQAVIDAGLTWIGPSPEVIAEMGSKIHARDVVTEIGKAGMVLRDPALFAFDVSVSSERGPREFANNG